MAMMSTSFKMPEEPPSLPSDDVESFVVLSRDYDSEEISMKIETNVLEEAKKIIDKELASVESLQNVPANQNGLPSVEDGFSIASVSSDLSAEAQQKIAQLIEENTQLKDALVENKNSMGNQLKILLSWKEKVLSIFEENKDKFAKAKTTIQDLKAFNAKLETDLEKERTLREVHENEIKSLKEQLNSIDSSQSSKGMEFQLNCNQKEIEKLTNDLKTLSLENEQIKVKDSALTDQIKLLQKELEEKNDLVNKLQEELKKQKNFFMEKENAYAEEINKLKLGQSMTRSPSEMDNLRKQLMNAQQTITDVQLNRNSLQDELDKQKKAMIDMEKRCEEERKVYESQLEVFKTDFESEKTAKEIFKKKSEDVLKDLANVQRRNEQLLEEVEMLRSRSGQIPRATAPDPPQNSPPSSTYSCPLCFQKFRSLRFLEQHVDFCLQDGS